MNIIKNILFQFHKGTIRTTYRKKFSTLNNDFNSIKVRLELGFPYTFAKR